MRWRDGALLTAAYSRAEGRGGGGRQSRTLILPATISASNAARSACAAWRSSDFSSTKLCAAPSRAARTSCAASSGDVYSPSSIAALTSLSVSGFGAARERAASHGTSRSAAACSVLAMAASWRATIAKGRAACSRGKRCAMCSFAIGGPAGCTGSPSASGSSAAASAGGAPPPSSTKIWEKRASNSPRTARAAAARSAAADVANRTGGIVRTAGACCFLRRSGSCSTVPLSSLELVVSVDHVMRFTATSRSALIPSLLAICRGVSSSIAL